MTQPGTQSSGAMTGIPLGRYGGVPVSAHWSVLLTALLVAEILATSVLPASTPHHSNGAYWLAGVAGAVIFLGSVLAHELMHAVAARHYGLRVDRITLWLLGGLAEIKSDPPTPRAGAVIAGAGPAASLVAGAGFVLGAWAASALGLSPLVASTLLWLGVTNGILGVFNLLPGAPLDGGRLLQALLWRHYQDRYRATVVATRVGARLGVALIGAGVAEALLLDVVGGLWTALIGWFLVGAARAESTGALMRSALPGVTVGELMRPLPAPVPTWWTVAHLREMPQLHQLVHDVVPVVDFDGRAVGVLTWRAVAGPAERGDATLGSLCQRLPVLPAESGALDAVRSGALGRSAALVQHPSGAIGLITAADVEHAAALHVTHPGGSSSASAARDG